MPTPPKPISLIKAEGNRRHLTKAEIAHREKEESQLLTGISLKEKEEVRKDPLAHKEFTRVKKLLKLINHDDDLYGDTINTHCELVAECGEYQEDKRSYRQDIKELIEEYQKGGMEFITYLDLKGSLQDKLMACDKKIMDKRKMRLDISKENIMTVKSALQSIPKKPEPKKDINPMAAYLAKKSENHA